jgi:hypothetical protein
MFVWRSTSKKFPQHNFKFLRESLSCKMGKKIFLIKTVCDWSRGKYLIYVIHKNIHYTYYVYVLHSNSRSNQQKSEFGCVSEIERKKDSSIRQVVTCLSIKIKYEKNPLSGLLVFRGEKKKMFNVNSRPKIWMNIEETRRNCLGLRCLGLSKRLCT